MRYWISWNQPSVDFRPMTVPDKSTSGILGYWCSGQSADQGENHYFTVCALVETGSQELAEALITNKKHWPDAGEWRFCNKQVDGWEPPSDRFPKSDDA